MSLWRWLFPQEILLSLQFSTNVINIFLNFIRLENVLPNIKTQQGNLASKSKSNFTRLDNLWSLTTLWPGSLVFSVRPTQLIIGGKGDHHDDFDDHVNDNEHNYNDNNDNMGNNRLQSTTPSKPLVPWEPTCVFPSLQIKVGLNIIIKVETSSSRSKHHHQGRNIIIKVGRNQSWWSLDFFCNWPKGASGKPS